MIKNYYNVIGVMSGTSLDGIDVIYASFEFDTHWKFSITHAETISYNASWVERLKGLVTYSLKEIQQIDREYTTFLASVINDFIYRNKITNIDAVCSHGHTALHQPQNKVTYQIGNKPHLATMLNQRVVCNFRRQDVELGGHGAPLVPIGDELLFSEYDYCMNFGGFANLSTKINNERVAHDICPANIVLNHYIKTLGLEYDDQGQLAAKGEINEALLQQLNDLEYYKQVGPKSLGLEWVNETVFPLIDAHETSIKNILRTFVEHIATQVAKSLAAKPNGSVLITGGGVYNTFLIERLQALTQNNIVIPSNKIVEFKEALIFGFLGILKLRNEINCLQSVTGASKNHSSGKVFMP